MQNGLEDSLVRDDQRLLDVLWALERGALGIGLVVDHNNRLRGLFTDGDLRRLILRGVAVDSPLSPHIKPNFVSVGPDAGRAEVLELMKALQLGQVPIVDPAGTLVGLHRLHDLIGVALRPNRAIIMAGGRGTRLLPLTERVPKPMLTVAGRPILERLVLHLMSFGIRHITLAINYLGHMIEEHFGDGSAFGCHIEYLRETKPLGTGGALSLLADRPEDPFIVMNGDLVTQANLGSMLDFHARGGQVGTMGIRRYHHTIPFGCVRLSGDRITACEEKPQLQETINTGMYVLSPEMLDLIPRDTDFGMPALFQTALSAGKLLRAFPFEDEWIDVGRKSELARAVGADDDDHDAGLAAAAAVPTIATETPSGGYKA
ncbi:MAG TPA: nucleotidyltransferase family protein [Polyangia bacterium]